MSASHFSSFRADRKERRWVSERGLYWRATLLWSTVLLQMLFFQPRSERLLKGDRSQDSIHSTALTNTAKVEGYYFLFKTHDHFQNVIMDISLFQLPQKHSVKWNRISRRISRLNSLETSSFTLQSEIYGYSPGLPFKRGYQEETLEIYSKS